MPKKIRELKKLLLKNGFQVRQGKGSHTVWRHEDLDYSIVLSGNDRNDAKKYQENEVQKAINRIKK